jgi:hypothetical protein
VHPGTKRGPEAAIANAEFVDVNLLMAASSHVAFFTAAAVQQKLMTAPTFEMPKIELSTPFCYNNDLTNR